VGAEKKGSGESPIEFLCSQTYNFWGLSIAIDEWHRPANEVRSGCTCPLDFRVTEVNAHCFPILALLAGLCFSSAVINNPQNS